MRFALTLALVLFASAASAQQITRQQLMELRSVCETDLRTLCAGVQPGNGRLAQCLQKNAASLSQPCAEKLAAIKAARVPN